MTVRSGPERVQAALEALGLEIAVVRVGVQAKTSAGAAAEVGCELGAIAKSLVLLVDEVPVMVICAGDRRVDLARLAALRGATQAAMAPAAVVRAATGYAIGGVSPVGHPAPLPIYLDRSLLRWETVWTAAGAPDALFPIPPATLQAVTGAVVADLSE